MVKEGEHIMYTVFDNNQATSKPTIKEIRTLIIDCLQLKPMLRTLEQLLVKRNVVNLYDNEILES